jgi:hypothetical protein
MKVLCALLLLLGMFTVSIRRSDGHQINFSLSLLTNTILLILLLTN